MIGRWIREYSDRRAKRAFDAPAVLSRFRSEANRSDSPRGLIWRRVAAAGPATWVRESGRPVALILIEIDFEPDDSGEMDDAPGLALTRAATLIVRSGRDGWVAEPKAIFNLSPEEVVARSGGRFTADERPL